jgi:hypothetical protein
LFGRDSLPNRSLAVLKFRSPDDASEFAEAYNGQNFSSTEVSGLQSQMNLAAEFVHEARDGACCATELNHCLALSHDRGGYA